MKEIDFLALDGKSLRTFLVVLEEQSVSHAATRLGVTQSAVSHTLDKLRLALGDPLFVRTGRNITATQRAIALREPVQEVLDGLKALTEKRVFDPLIGSMKFTISANDFQRDLIFPSLVSKFREMGIDIELHFLQSANPTIDTLKQGHCNLLITPVPPESPVLYQKRLFDDIGRCFYDPNSREAPVTEEDFTEADYLDVTFKALRGTSNSRGVKPKITVPNFADLPSFLRGSRLLTSQLSLLGKTHLQGFASVPERENFLSFTMYMVWHKREHLDPASQWLRREIVEHIRQVL